MIDQQKMTSPCDYSRGPELEKLLESDPEVEEDTRILKMLYKGNLAELSRRDEKRRRAKVVGPKHDFYR